MKIIDSREAISSLRAAGRYPPALLDLIAQRMADVIAAFADAGWNWDPDEHGAFVILEAGDGSDEFETIGLNREEGLVGACWESCYHHLGPERAWEVLYLFSNDGGWTVFIPMDADWLDERLIAKLEDEATEPFAVATGAGDADRSPF